jgi:hypothetical protein
MSISFTAGQTLTAAALNALVPLEAQLSSDQSKTSNTTFADLTDLTLAVEANATYQVEGLFIATSAANAAGDVKYRFSYPANATMTITGPGPHNSLASGSQADGEWFYVLLDNSSPTADIPYGASTAGAAAIINGKLVVGATAGDLVVGWAQQSSNANATVFKAGSYIRLRRTA